VLYNAGAELFALAAVSQRDVWAVGAQGTHATIVHWGSRGWRDTDLPDLGTTTSVLFDVAATGPQDVWAVGRADLQPLVLHWHGQRWLRVSIAQIGGDSAVFSTLVVGGQKDVWVLGSAAEQRNSTPHTIAEHWDGTAWRAAPAPPGHSIIAAANGT